MITHFALHGNVNETSAEKLNRTSIHMMDLMEMVLEKSAAGETAACWPIPSLPP
jgi:hypothetical protein